MKPVVVIVNFNVGDTFCNDVSQLSLSLSFIPCVFVLNFLIGYFIFTIFGHSCFDAFIKPYLIMFGVSLSDHIWLWSDYHISCHVPVTWCVRYPVMWKSCFSRMIPVHLICWLSCVSHAAITRHSRLNQFAVCGAFSKLAVILAWVSVEIFHFIVLCECPMTPRQCRGKGKWGPPRNFTWGPIRYWPIIMNCSKKS